MNDETKKATSADEEGHYLLADFYHNLLIEAHEKIEKLEAEFKAFVERVHTRIGGVL